MGTLADGEAATTGAPKPIFAPLELVLSVTVLICGLARREKGKPFLARQAGRKRRATSSTQQLHSLNNEFLDRAGVEILSEIWREEKGWRRLWTALYYPFHSRGVWPLNGYLKRKRVASYAFIYSC